MMRGTFANIRIRNRMLPEVEGGFTRHIPSGGIMSIYRAGMKYKDKGIPLIVVAGREYGTSSGTGQQKEPPFLESKWCWRKTLREFTGAT